MEYSMNEILDIFSNCDKFSLTSTIPITEIPKKDKIKLLNNHLNDVKQRLQDIYNKASQTETSLPEFNVLFDDIVDECTKFYGNIRGKDIIKLCNNGNSPFICDHIGKDTKYSEPLKLIWPFYHNIQQVLMSDDNLINLSECNELNTEKIFSDSKDKILKENLLSYEFTYLTHCTDGPLQLVLYFPLNENTKKWLLQFENDYDLGNSNFEDLAIYNKGEIKFSSCTHELFNSLDSYFSLIN